MVLIGWYVGLAFVVLFLTFIILTFLVTSPDARSGPRVSGDGAGRQPGFAGEPTPPTTLSKLFQCYSTHDLDTLWDTQHSCNILQHIFHKLL